jgi:hypothetical protein
MPSEAAAKQVAMPLGKRLIPMKVVLAKTSHSRTSYGGWSRMGLFRLLFASAPAVALGLKHRSTHGLTLA